MFLCWPNKCVRFLSCTVFVCEYFLSLTAALNSGIFKVFFYLPICQGSFHLSRLNH